MAAILYTSPEPRAFLRKRATKRACPPEAARVASWLSRKECAMDRQRGFTVTEVLMTIAIAAVLTGASIPAFRGLRRDGARTRGGNQFVQAVHLVSGESVERRGVARAW